jgi:large conductance mechanosensitive channel
MGIVKEFKEFAIKGNMIDMAVGIIIGGAFGKIIASLVNDIIMPPLGMLLGKVNFTDLYVTLDGSEFANLAAARAAGAPVLAYGNFIQTFIDFLIIAFAIFMMIKAMNRMRKKQEAAPAPPPEPSAQEKLLTEIRDLLKK